MANCCLLISKVLAGSLSSDTSEPYRTRVLSFRLISAVGDNVTIVRFTQNLLEESVGQVAKMLCMSAGLTDLINALSADQRKCPSSMRLVRVSGTIAVYV
jgi:hypothetical protein